MKEKVKKKRVNIKYLTIHILTVKKTDFISNITRLVAV